MSLNTTIFPPHLLFLCFRSSIHFCVYYTYMSNQKIHFLHNAMMINLFPVKIITTHKSFFLFYQTSICPATYTFRRQAQICCEEHVSSYTHIYEQSRIWLHTICTNIHKKIYMQIYIYLLLCVCVCVCVCVIKIMEKNLRVWRKIEKQ